MNNNRLFSPCVALHVLLVVSVFFVPSTLFAQYLEFERIPNELGLSQNLISVLHQDQEGFIWVGTKNGLNRFDGYSFEVFTHDPFDTLTISNNYVQSIFEDREGHLWIGTEKGLNLFDREKGIFKRIKGKVPFQNEIAIEELIVTSILEDSKNNLWIGTSLNGIVYLEKGSGDFLKPKLHLPNQSKTKIKWQNSVAKLFEGPNGKIWVFRPKHISWISQRSSNQLYQETIVNWDNILDAQWIPKDNKELPIKTNKKILFDNNAYSIFQGKNKSIWLRTLDGVGQWNPSTSRFDFHPMDFDRSDYSQSPLIGTGETGFEDSKGRIWLAGFYSWVVYNPEQHKIETFYNNYSESTQEGNLTYNVRSLLEDKSGNFWLGTNGHGLYKHAPLKYRFNDKNLATKLTGHSIRSIYETKDGNVWFGDTEVRFKQWNRNKESAPQTIDLTKFGWLKKGVIDFTYVFSMHEDRKGNFWIGCNTLLKAKLQNGEITEVKGYPILESTDAVYDIHEDEEGEIWLITNLSFGRFDTEEEIFYGLNYFNDEKSLLNRSGTPVIHQAKDGIFWLGTSDGLKKYRAGRSTFTDFKSDPNDRNSLSDNGVKSICPDPQKPDEVLWIGTNSGLNRFEITTQSFTHFKKEDGLPDDVIYSILPDEFGNLWLSTNQGIVCFDPVKNTFKTYTKSDGLQENEFNSCAYHQSTSGEMFFGGIAGFNAFYPTDIQANGFEPPVVITDLYLANQWVDFKDPEAPIDAPISKVNELVLSPNEDIFSLEFAALDYTEPTRNQFAYLLENFNTEWQETGNKNSVTFTNLDPGDYLFKVKGTNFDGKWSENYASLKITILPPWWKTWWAYLGYILFSGALFYFIYRLLLRQQLERTEALRIKEMDGLKSRLYANITHEFRTPLTVIMGMTENISGHVSEKKLIKRNSENLLRLVNQLLDLSKAEDGKLKVKYIQADILPYLKYLCESFQSLVQGKNIELVFYTESNQVNMDFDAVKIQQIIFNLMSNAIKFTPRNGQIVFHVSNPEIKNEPILNLKVRDTGVGIPKDKLVHIFDRFYQVDNTATRAGEGTGIGLALTKELVELMEGEIFVESEIGKGTMFSINLPIQQLAEKVPPASLQSDLIITKPEPELEKKTENESNLKKEGLPLLLLVEDNADVAAYIKITLEKEYQIIWENNGKKGIEKAFEIIPDIIISDVMMPEKDGFELTHALKNDERTSHIPIVLLTAKVMEKDKIDGLRAGADAYLMKPFNKEELIVRLEKLLSIRRALMQRYKEDISWLRPVPKAVKTAESPPFNKEDDFLKKLREIVEANMDNTEFDVPQLCKSVHLSHTHVYRKLKALLDKTPSQFIRRIRLQKSLELLQNSDMNVSEIAYDTGFNDPAYFSRMFSKEFGKPPSDFRK